MPFTPWLGWTLWLRKGYSFVMPYALHDAAEHGQLGELVRLFVLGLPGETVDIESRNAAGETPLHAAVRSGRIDVVILLLCNGAEVNAVATATTDRPGTGTPLHVACSMGNAQIGRHLLVSGADPNATTSVTPAGLGGDTPLHLAAANGHLELARILLTNGANPNAVNGRGVTPLGLAASNGHLQIVDELVSHGADPSQKCLSPHHPSDLASEANKASTSAAEDASVGAAPAATPVQAFASTPPPAQEIKTAETNATEIQAKPVTQEPAASPPPASAKDKAGGLDMRPPPLPVQSQGHVSEHLNPTNPVPPTGVGRKDRPVTPAAPGDKPPKLDIHTQERRSDPTLNWGTFRKPIPDFDVSRMQFGSLRFGDGLKGAAFLGRPDRFSAKERDYCELLYARGGFQLDFDQNRFVYLAFFIAPDACLPEHPGLEFSAPRLRGDSLSGIHLTRLTDRATLERIFGSPESVDADAQEAVLFYSRLRVTMEFELDTRTGRLKRWNLYPTKMGRQR